jgi:type VI secretion system protein ImpE
VVLARKTDWLSLADDFYVGSGQRMFATDAGEYPLLDVRTISFDSV